MAPATVLKKRGAKSEEEGEVFGGGAMDGGGGITEHPKTVCEAAEAGSMGEPCAAGVTKRPGSIEEDALAVSKRPRANGEEEEDVFGCGGGITERPKTEGEMAAAEAGSKGEPCAAGVTKRPGSIEEESLAVGKRPGAEFEEEAADYDSEKEHVRQNFVYKKMLTRPHAAPGKDGKRRTVVRLDKESVEIRMSQPPPTPYPRMSDKHIDRIERRRPGFRAEEDECTALGQKLIDRDAEMRRQYALYGYAELEFTDDDDDDDVDEMMKNWRSMAELKAAGCFDGY
ncbi:unnamed protein product [Urochloa humidicola]